MASTRELVLKFLVENQGCTINDLADAVHINPISVRHHISKLEDAALVRSEDERHGVGRPRRVYFLTEKGIEQFPARTIRLTSKIIRQLKETLPQEGIDKLFRDMGGNFNMEEQQGIKEMSLDERLRFIDQQLKKEGFSVHIERTADEILIHETNCPYFHVGQEHSEVCTIDQELINSVLDAESERTNCLLNGDAHCTYTVPLESIQI